MSRLRVLLLVQKLMDRDLISKGFNFQVNCCYDPFLVFVSIISFSLMYRHQCHGDSECLGVLLLLF